MPSRALIKEDKRCQGSGLQGKLGSVIRFDETETDVWTCSPMQFVA